MTRITRRTVKKQKYYYLEHSVREGKKVIKHQEYLGKTIPTDIEKRKVEFLQNIMNETRHSMLERIKQEYLREQAQTPKSAQEIEQTKFSITFTYDTQRIEGSALTRKETADLLERGITPKEKPIADVKEAEAHRRTFEEMLKEKKDISLQRILEWHYKLFKETKPDIAGKIRKHQVAIARSKFLPPAPVEVQPLLMEFFSWYAKERNNIHPVELAALVHLRFVTIHPFSDGNGRISRLLMNFVLHRYRYPLLNISYEKRAGYYNSLEKSQVNKEESKFVQWFVRTYVKTHKRYT